MYEFVAARYLKRMGFCLLSLNKVIPGAEADLIVWDKRRKERVLVEVRGRAFNRASQFLSSKKITKLRCLAARLGIHQVILIEIVGPVAPPKWMGIYQAIRYRAYFKINRYPIEF